MLSLAALIACALLAGAVFATGARAATGELETLTSSPAELTSITSDTSTNIVYAQEYNGAETGFYSYDPRTNVWITLAEAPIHSGNNGGAAYLDGKIYTSYTEEDTLVGVYDIASNTWSTIPNPLGKGTADITAYGEDLYMAEGDTFISYDPATETTTTLAEPPSFPAECGGSGLEPWGGLEGYEGKIYGSQGNGCDGFGVYDIATNEWSELPAAPGGTVAGSALDPVSGTYFAYGSYGESNLYHYDIATEEWTTSSLPFTVEDGGMAYIPLAGATGIYIPPGEEGTGFVRYLIGSAAADLSLTQTTSASASVVGSEITYTIKVATSGPAQASAATVSDSLPADVSFVSSSSTQGSCSGSATVTCGLGDIVNGASATVTITVKAAAEGTASNTAVATSSTTDPNTANNSATVSSTIAAVPVVSARPALLPARWQVPNGILRVGRGVKWVSDPLTNLNSSLSLSGTAELVSYVAPGGHGASTVLARNSVYLTAGATRTLYLRLSASALSRLRTGHRSVVQLVLTLTDPFGRPVKATGVYYLVGSKPKHHKK